jgi:hypothetical protein
MAVCIAILAEHTKDFRLLPERGRGARDGDLSESVNGFGLGHTYLGF